MRAFEELTSLGQARRVRKLVKSALEAYGLSDARIKLVAHWENTTFRVDAPDSSPSGNANCPYIPGRFLLRIHRPDYQNAETIASELTWLTALRNDMELSVPEPVATLQGEPFTIAEAPGVPSRRVCSLLRWMRGRIQQHCPRLTHFKALGELMAHLHNHASSWKPPLNFTRQRWDWVGLFGNNGEGECDSAYEVAWELLPTEHRELLEAVAEHVTQAMRELGESSDVFGLIHADLHLNNVLFSNDEARAIDFDDCGFGYWIYDFVIALGYCLERNDRSALYNAFFEGYEKHRPVPKEQLEYLDVFRAGRDVSLALWAIGRSQDHPEFRENLQNWLDWAAEDAKRFLMKSKYLYVVK